MHVEHLYLWTRPTFLTVNCIPTAVAMNQDERAHFDRALHLHRARLSAYPAGEFVGQQGFMRASEIRAPAVEARGRRRWPADSAARTGNPAAARPATVARRGSAPAARPAGRVGDGCSLDGLPRVHHQCAVGEFSDHPQMINTPAPATSRGLQHLEDLRPHGYIQRGRGLVADQQVGVVGDRDRDDHVLAFPAAQFVREGPGPALRLGDAH